MAHNSSAAGDAAQTGGYQSWWQRAQGSGKGADHAARVTTNRRLRITVIIVLVMALLLGGRLLYLQVIRAPALADVAKDFRTASYKQQALRGDIVDTQGTVLATSVPRYNVRADQVALEDYVSYSEDGKTIVGVGPAAAAKKLAPVLGVDEARLGGTLLGPRGENTNQWALIASGLSSDQWQKVKDLGIHGIYPERYMERIYPNGNTAGNVLGYVGQSADDELVRGRAGIESSMDKTLAGQDGSISAEVGPYGTTFPDSERVTKKAVDGREVQLTLDADIQRAAQDAVDAQVKKTHATWGTAVVLEIGTGAILTLADSASPDPSQLNKTSTENWGARSVSSAVEPGSVGKLMTLAAAIDQQKVTPLTPVTVASNMTMPNGEEISDADNHATETMTVAGGLAKSYNTAMVQVGDTISDQVRYSYLQKFGLGKPTGIELPAETSGLLRPYDQWGSRDHYMTMIGQALSVNTLQLAQMVAVFGQQGTLIPPHIVQGYEDESGVYTPTVVGTAQRVVSKETAQTMLQVMQGVTRDGATAGKLGRIAGYNVAGKTGTGENADSSGALTNTVTSFVGIVPADSPRVAIAVTLYFQGSYVPGAAVPVFQKIGEYTMRDLKVSPSTQPLFEYPWYPSGN
ncbi:MAG: penicillin-binding protein 2 [Actinomycetaceae bacterium]|nr:penicillin-binding protein 2 [Arcanobacterium sp.]MDD7687356.1 penicillin-binding protein 2 [Actinomycetaceae bacterium]MDY5274125.1 penicillin-binding protein 2 [Arcanobacterium sp.]